MTEILALGCAPDLSAPRAAGGSGGIGGTGSGAGGLTCGAHVWSRALKSAGLAGQVRAAAVGGGGALVAGDAPGAMDFGQGLLEGGGGVDAFVAKLDGAGDVVFAALLGDESAQHSNAVAETGDGGALVAGDFAGALGLGGTMYTSAGGRDGFVARFSPAGGAQWLVPITGVMDQIAMGAAPAPDGGAIVTGSFEGALTAGSSSLEGAGGKDAFVLRLDAEGKTAWAQRFGDERDQAGCGVVADADGGAVIFGEFEGTLDLGGHVLEAAGQGERFIARLGAAGAPLWSRRVSGADVGCALRAGVDEGGDVIVAGAGAAGVDLGGGEISGNDGGLFVAKLDSAGAHVWSRGFAGAGTASVSSVSADAAGNVLVAGELAGRLDLGDEVLESAAGQMEGFLLWLTGNGEVACATRLGGAAVRSTSAAIGAAGDVVLAGALIGVVNLGGNTVGAEGEESVLVAKLLPPVQGGGH